MISFGSVGVHLSIATRALKFPVPRLLSPLSQGVPIFTPLILAFFLMPLPPPEPAGFIINVDASRGTEVALFIGDKRIEAGKLYVVKGAYPSKLTVEARYVDYDTRKVYRFDVNLTPGYITEITLTIRAAPPLELLARK